MDDEYHKIYENNNSDVYANNDDVRDNNLSSDQT